jgi:RNA polymerase sigma factor (sigma-70 family)
MEFENESDEELLCWMTVREDPKSREAWRVFYLRHVEEVLARVRRAHRDVDAAGVQDLVEETFLRAWDRAGTFKQQAVDPAERRRKVVAWLCRIAKRIFLDAVCSRAGVRVDPFPEDFPEPADRDPDEPQHGPKARLAAELLNELEDMERTVLIETGRWTNVETGRCRLPPKVADELAARFGTSKMNLRQVRHRLREEFKSRLSERIQKRSGT